ncbi:uncharacterized protein EV420DRAFT_1645103 [Desarmillaria tabescens]|uniref:Uncharacterized protein n=1 Tax=Armillaria tabescens TaxID=1929756 RepID=A0AA39K481_ARMTA|nr:uncharacterized protein EV420DRAFT_1645103 [Desarmillaria tabescens]KAK0454210.1 hypothetical protein EV420DRAFT_1645103 [Desarmillaria tabescens]
MTSFFPNFPSSQQKPMKDHYLVATDANISVFIRRSDVTHYQDLVTLLLCHFTSTSTQSIVIQTNELDICAGRYVDIPPDLWPEINPQIQNIKVISHPSFLTHHHHR